MVKNSVETFFAQLFSEKSGRGLPIITNGQNFKN